MRGLTILLGMRGDGIQISYISSTPLLEIVGKIHGENV